MNKHLITLVLFFTLPVSVFAKSPAGMEETANYILKWVNGLYERFDMNVRLEAASPTDFCSFKMRTTKQSSYWTPDWTEKTDKIDLFYIPVRETHIYGDYKYGPAAKNKKTGTVGYMDYKINNDGYDPKVSEYAQIFSKTVTLGCYGENLGCIHQVTTRHTTKIVDGKPGKVETDKDFHTLNKSHWISPLVFVRDYPSLEYNLGTAWQHLRKLCYASEKGSVAKELRLQ